MAGVTAGAAVEAVVSGETRAGTGGELLAVKTQMKQCLALKTSKHTQEGCFRSALSRQTTLDLFIWVLWTLVPLSLKRQVGMDVQRSLVVPTSSDSKLPHLC